MKPGALVGARYRIVRLLGRGGMGEVYEVVDAQLDRARALKLMYAHATDRGEGRARFDLEARIAGRVDSPFLVEVLDTGIDPDSDRLFIVMELLAGEDLGQRLARLGRRPADEVVAHLGQLALALARMHAHGIVHRDLKPTNLFLQERDGEPARVKVLDLGIAKVLAAGGDTTTVAGTPEYMAPEQLRGRGIGAGTDVHALGLIAYTLLVGCAYWSEARTQDPIAFGLLAVQGAREPAGVRGRGAGVELPAA
ncbi:MAG: serine/threonine protein kinase, partial [Deltaproteobacteria bacterium]|nr:serine/threonine protein kinase [Deltaproteobacteria bacterium]